MSRESDITRVKAAIKTASILPVIQALVKLEVPPQEIFEFVRGWYKNTYRFSHTDEGVIAAIHLRAADVSEEVIFRCLYPPEEFTMPYANYLHRAFGRVMIAFPRDPLSWWIQAANKVGWEDAQIYDALWIVTSGPLERLVYELMDAGWDNDRIKACHKRELQSVEELHDHYLEKGIKNGDDLLRKLRISVDTTEPRSE